MNDATNSPAMSLAQALSLNDAASHRANLMFAHISSAMSRSSSFDRLKSQLQILAAAFSSSAKEAEETQERWYTWHHEQAGLVRQTLFATFAVRQELAALRAAFSAFVARVPQEMARIAGECVSQALHARGREDELQQRRFSQALSAATSNAADMAQSRAAAVAERDELKKKLSAAQQALTQAEQAWTAQHRETEHALSAQKSISAHKELIIQQLEEALELADATIVNKDTTIKKMQQSISVLTRRPN